MRIEYKPAFGRSLKHLHLNEQKRVKQTIEKVIDFYATGNRTPGLGLTHLRGAFWEARSGLKTRVLYRWQIDLIEIILAGNHDDAKRFLKRQV